MGQEAQRQLSDRMEAREKRSWSAASTTTTPGNTLERRRRREDKEDRRARTQEDKVGELIKELHLDDVTDGLEVASKEVPNGIKEVPLEIKEERRRSSVIEGDAGLAGRLARLEQLVGEGWSSSTREVVRREETVHRDSRETHQATYILRCLLSSCPPGPGHLPSPLLPLRSPGGGQYLPRDPGDGWEEGRRGGLGEEVERLAGLLNMLLQQESAATRYHHHTNGRSKVWSSVKKA